jgi:hypothetical protein
MKCFITLLLLACTSYLANAQAPLPADVRTITLKATGPVSQHRQFRSQSARHFTVKSPAIRPEAAQFYDAAPTIEMNRFAGYVLLYERTAGATMAEGRMAFRHYEMRKRAGGAGKIFSAAVTAVLRMYP